MTEDTPVSGNNSASDIDQPEIKSESDKLVICVFHNCMEQNVKLCRKCNRAFCIMHANRFSPNFCQDCFRNLAVIESKFKRTFEYVNPLNHQSHIREQTQTRYYMDGADWPFVTPWIHSLTDQEFKDLWVFHHCILRLIESENETRNIERARKYRETGPKLISRTTSTSTTKTRVTKQQDTPETLKAKWKKMGMTDEVIGMMIAALEKKP